MRPQKHVSRAPPCRRNMPVRALCSTIPRDRGDESFADDLNMGRGIVSGRVALLLRSTEIRPHRPNDLCYPSRPATPGCCSSCASRPNTCGKKLNRAQGLKRRCGTRNSRVPGLQGRCGTPNSDIGKRRDSQGRCGTPNSDIGNCRDSRFSLANLELNFESFSFNFNFSFSKNERWQENLSREEGGWARNTNTGKEKKGKRGIFK